MGCDTNHMMNIRNSLKSVPLSFGTTIFTLLVKRVFHLLLPLKLWTNSQSKICLPNASLQTWPLLISVLSKQKLEKCFSCAPAIWAWKHWSQWCWYGKMLIWMKFPKVLIAPSVLGATSAIMLLKSTGNGFIPNDTKAYTSFKTAVLKILFPVPLMWK